MSGSQGAFLNALDPLSGMTNPFEFSNPVFRRHARMRSMWRSCRHSGRRA